MPDPNDDVAAAIPAPANDDDAHHEVVSKKLGETVMAEVNGDVDMAMAILAMTIEKLCLAALPASHAWSNLAYGFSAYAERAREKLKETTDAANGG